VIKFDATGLTVKDHKGRQRHRRWVAYERPTVKARDAGVVEPYPELA
jgi:hypothetical protein